MKEIEIYTPGMHKINGIRFPYELHIKSFGIDGSVVTIITVFDIIENGENSFLKSLGFGDEKIKKAVENQKYIDDKDINITLSDLIGIKLHFIIYMGQSFTPPCGSSLYIYQHDPLWMSPAQAAELSAPENILVPDKDRQGEQVLYQNLYKVPSIFNIQESRPNMTPMSPLQNHFSYEPSLDQTKKPIGFISEKDIPGWEQVLKTQLVHEQHQPEQPPSYKYIPYYYETNEKDDTLLPKYIIVDKDFLYPENITLASVGIYIRKRFEVNKAGVREIEKLIMPIRWEKLTKLKKAAAKKKEDEIQKNKEKEKLKNIQDAPQPGQFDNTVDPAKLAAKAADDKKKKEELKEKKRKQAKYLEKRVCVKWDMNVVLNQHWEHQDSWKKIYKRLDEQRLRDSQGKSSEDIGQDKELVDPNTLKMIKCNQYKVFKIPLLERNDDNVDELGHRIRKTGKVNNNNKQKKQMTWNDCEYKLHQVLNNMNNDDETTDFIAKECDGETTHISIADRGLHEVIKNPKVVGMGVRVMDKQQEQAKLSPN